MRHKTNHLYKTYFNEHISDWVYWIALKLDPLILLFENTALTAHLNILLGYIID